MLRDGIDGLGDADHAICVVGAGPVGLALATDLAKAGRRVLLLESGGDAASAEAQALSDAEIVDAARHDPMSVAVARRLGGTSNLWGARCLPYDPIDFEERDWVGACWPIGHDELMRWVPAAVATTRSGLPSYHAPLPPWLPLADDRFDATALERWANVQAAQHIQAEAIAREPLLDVRIHATAVGLHLRENGTVAAIDIADTRSGARARVPVATLVLAMGGIETTRLLLAARAEAPQRFGGEEGALGHYYMGHLVGEIADLAFARPEGDTAFQFYVDAGGSYVRRRMVASAAAQREHRLLNTALWPVVPPIADAAHGSAILSMVYLAMRSGPIGRLVVAEAIRRRQAPDPAPPLLPHVRNLVTGAPAAAAFAADFLRRRYDKKTRLPGFFVRNPRHRYGLTFHAEQHPRRESGVALTGERDRLGLLKVRIDFRYHPDDVASVLRTHDLFEEWLAASGLGRLDYRGPRESRAEAVWRLLVHGTHQIGLARMAATRREGVVDPELAVWGAPNLHLATTAVLPTSGQANPTLTAVALAHRLAAKLAREAATPFATRGLEELTR